MRLMKFEDESYVEVGIREIYYLGGDCRRIELFFPYVLANLLFGIEFRLFEKFDIFHDALSIIEFLFLADIFLLDFFTLFFLI